MRKLRAWVLRCKGLFVKDARERDFADELESHRQMHIDDNLRRGMSPEEARRVAVMKLGGVDQAKEAYRDRGTVPLLESAIQDLRFTLRQLRKNPAFTVTATAMVALGIGIAGIVIGTGCAILAASLMRKLLFGTPPWDVVTLVSVAAVLGASALLASFLPARRAASVDPISALRAE